MGMTDQDQAETKQEKAGEQPRQDWTKLAAEALDLWQNHLTSLANDQSMKDDMARFVAPMSQMFEQWTSMMQSGLASVMPQGWPEAAEGGKPDAHAAQQETNAAQHNQQQKGQTPPPDDEHVDTPFDVVLDDETPVEDAIRPVAEGPQNNDDEHVDTPFDVVMDDETPLETKTDEALAEILGKFSLNDDGVSFATSSEPTIRAEHGSAKPAAAVAITLPEPIVRQQPAEPKPSEPKPRGRSALADGHGDLAELAGRLANLERELEALRARPKRTQGDDGAVASENADAHTSAAGNVQRVAGSGS